jgi:hypothetical protein
MTAESRPIGEAPSAGLARIADSPLLVKLIAGAVILALWELGVRAWAPAYVARPSGVLAVLPSVVASGAFL